MISAAKNAAIAPCRIRFWIDASIPLTLLLLIVNEQDNNLACGQLLSLM